MIIGDHRIDDLKDDALIEDSENREPNLRSVEGRNLRLDESPRREENQSHPSVEPDRDQNHQFAVQSRHQLRPDVNRRVESHHRDDQNRLCSVTKGMKLLLFKLIKL